MSASARQLKFLGSLLWAVPLVLLLLLVEAVVDFGRAVVSEYKYLRKEWRSL